MVNGRGLELGAPHQIIAAHISTLSLKFEDRTKVQNSGLRFYSSQPKILNFRFRF